MSTELIRIPTVRADQLRRLAAHKNVTVSDLVGDLVTREIKRLDLTKEIGMGTLADVCELENGEVAISMPGLGNLSWSKATAVSVADTLSTMTTPGRLHGKLDLDAGVEFWRKGRGVILKNVETGESVSMSTPIAAELGDFIRAVAA